MKSKLSSPLSFVSFLAPVFALSACSGESSSGDSGGSPSTGGVQGQGGNSMQSGGSANGGSSTTQGGAVTQGGNASTQGGTAGAAPGGNAGTAALGGNAGTASGGLLGGTGGSSAGANNFSGGNAGASTGGTANGGGSKGGTASGGAANGGTANGGTANGGTANGGASAGSATGGASGKGGSAGSPGSGGTATGGAGGKAAGGANTGGTTGGSATGGTSTGGVAGGNATGGVVTGGASTGGTSTGGTATGGAGGGGNVTGKTYYVTPTGKSTNDGSSFANAMDFATARSRVVAGDAILLQAGTYPVAYTASAKNTITFSQQGTSAKPIRVSVDGTGRAVFDFSFPDQQWVQDSYGFFVTGSYWTFKGLDIIHAGYQGAYVTGQHNTFENCSFHDNRNTGLEINEGGAYTTVINCDAYRNYDPKKAGSMADGFGPKQTQGPGNKFIGCRAWENSDDGFDCFDSPQTVTFENCTAFRNGVDVWNYGGFMGNGNGFKIGGNAAQANHKLTQCAAFSNRVKGFDQNNNTGGLTLYNCTSYSNGINFGLGGTLNSGQKHDVRNSISLGGADADTISNATQQNNSWSSGFSVSAGDFLSVDVSLGSAARSPDGSLPVNNFLHLKPGSALIDKGVNVGLPFNGTAPDLGAYETN
ncbi:MAG TPA: right-handed parallel beta-helix repeat-containing protein [Polyangiaceae bacterium]|nr:right-handed parallel beta-helix repeat-containing protein [Polyangiaceae bacterium]